MGFPSIKTLQSNFRDLSRPGAVAIRAAMESANTGREVEDAMMAIDKILDGHGVEAIESRESRWRGGRVNRGFWGDTMAIYVNMGDTYNATVLYDINANRFTVTSWGEFFERNERKYNIR